jgi:UDP-N-acetylmuramoylalanine--D-glutamate ligase
MGTMPMQCEFIMDGAIAGLPGLKNVRVTVVGLGRFGGGIGVTRWLCGQGARVTVSDSAPAEKLADSIAALKGCDVALHLGANDPADATSAELVVVNPAVPKTAPVVRAALAAGVPCTTEINLFVQRCAAPIVAITGSVGKSTTTAMTGAMLAARYTVHVGGNIGKSLLDDLPAIRPQHVVVLELSSFQLEDLPLVRFAPRVALVTNLKPNHLDRYDNNIDAYADAKKNIFRFQSGRDLLLLNRDDAPTRAWATEAPARVEFYGNSDESFELAVPGEHNRLNAKAAFAVAREMGVTRQQAAEAVRNFAGLEHRLQFVCERGRVRYFNDSKCTTPEGAVVALEAFDPGRVVLIAGGSDKHVSMDALGAAAAVRAKAVVALGQTREQIVAAVEAHRSGAAPAVLRADAFEQAVNLAKSAASPGDVVLLSPACASYDMFTNYEERGRLFVSLVARTSAASEAQPSRPSPDGPNRGAVV